MTTQTEALKLALEALKTYHGYMEPLLTVFGGPRVPAEKSTTSQVEQAIKSLEEALAKQEQSKPVAYDVRCDNCGGDGYDPKDNNYFCSSCEGSRFLEKLLYTTPQQRKPMTNENPLLVFAKECVLGAYSETELADAAFRAIEAAHNIQPDTGVEE
jgi:hypothetical protein